MRFAGRAAAWLAGIWAGILVCVAAMAAPLAFAVLPVGEAGRFAGRLFGQEAYLSLTLALVIFLIERQRSRLRAEKGVGRAFSAELMLVCGAFFCTVAGYFALEPMMSAARSGQGSLSFGTLHALAGAFFVLKGLIVMVLAWRLAGAAIRTTGTTS